MAIRTYKVTLDTKNTIAPEPVYLRQGDKTGAVVIDATLMDNGAPISLDGLTPMFKANTADGQAVITDSTGFNIVNASGGEFTYQVPNALSAVPGKIMTAYFSFSDTSGSESTFDVAFVIKKAVDITQAQADEYITIIDGTIQSLQHKIDAMNTDVQTILNAFNQGDFYNKTQTDSKDAATLASAKTYADSGDSATLASAQNYVSIEQSVDNVEDIGKEYLTSAHAQYRRVGKIVLFDLVLNFSKVTTAVVSFFAIPSGFTVATASNAIGLAIGKSTIAYSGQAIATMDGYIKVSSSVTGNVYISGAWITDDDFPD